MPSVREQKKRQTRKSLMDAALELVGQGENFASISLREVAKNAGVVPTSFYRHFTSMEDLGLNLVDDLGMLLRRLMRSARQRKGPINTLIADSVKVYMDFVLDNKNYFYFMGQCRTGGTFELRQAIRNELRYFVNELVSDLQQIKLFKQINSEDLHMIAQLVVGTVEEITIDLLDLADSSDTYLDELQKQTEKKIRLIFLGVNQWQSSGKEK